MKANGNIIKVWLSNNGYKSRVFGHFIAVYGTNKQKISDLLKDIKVQFPENNSYVNDSSSDIFISIDL